MNPAGSRTKPASAPAVLSIGTIQGGTSLNTIAEKVVIAGILRTSGEELCLAIKQKIKSLLSVLELKYSAKCIYEELLVYPAVYNDEKLSQYASKALDGFAVTAAPVMMADDFSYFQKEVAGLMMLLGTGEPEKGLHNSRFDFDEDILAIGLHAYLKLLSKGNE